jgi:hypothetical protein
LTGLADEPPTVADEDVDVVELYRNLARGMLQSHRLGLNAEVPTVLQSARTTVPLMNNKRQRRQAVDKTRIPPTVRKIQSF